MMPHKGYRHLWLPASVTLALITSLVIRVSPQQLLTPPVKLRGCR